MKYKVDYIDLIKYSFKQGFLSFSTIDILDQIVFC